MAPSLPTGGVGLLPKTWDNTAAAFASNAPFAGFVKMEGGAYFFLPSLTFLKNL